MTEAAERFRVVAEGFAGVVAAVDDESWANPTPCEGWAARDIVAHLVEWPGGLLTAFGIELGAVPAVDTDPAGAWAVVQAAIQGGLDDPATAQRIGQFGPMDPMTFEAAVTMAPGWP